MANGRCAGMSWDSWLPGGLVGWRLPSLPLLPPTAACGSSVLNPHSWSCRRHWAPRPSLQKAQRQPSLAPWGAANQRAWLGRHRAPRRALRVVPTSLVVCLPVGQPTFHFPTTLSETASPMLLLGLQGGPGGRSRPERLPSLVLQASETPSAHLHTCAQALTCTNAHMLCTHTCTGLLIHNHVFTQLHAHSSTCASHRHIYVHTSVRVHEHMFAQAPYLLIHTDLGIEPTLTVAAKGGQHSSESHLHSKTGINELLKNNNSIHLTSHGTRGCLW